MPSKKSSNSSSDKSKFATAPTLPSDLMKQIKDDKPDASNSKAHKITVNKVPPKVVEEKVPEATNAEPSTTIDNPETDKAVDDIMANESDKLLAVDDALAAKRSQPTKSLGWRDKLRNILKNKWTWIGVGVVLLLVLVIPYSRYKLLGIVVREKVDITIIDSQTSTPISNAIVSTSGASLKTDAYGKVALKAGVGEKTITITKQYYKTGLAHYFVGFKKNKPLLVKLSATGRLIPITVTNTISGKPLAGAVIHILATSSKTNSKGQATIAVPAGSSKDSAQLSLSGYNSQKVSVAVTSEVLASNSFSLTPSGTIYFLSNQSGSIDVVRSNLDGSNQQTVLAGSGHETATTTRLIASKDWRYLVLEANHDGSRPALYLIDASNNQSTEFDSSNSTFSLIGWQGHNFLYSLKSNTANQWQSGSQVIKSYDADATQLNQIDQNQAIGNSSSYAYQTLANFYIVGSTLVYDTQWNASGGYDLGNQNDTIRTYDFGSQAKKDTESFASASSGTLQATKYQPQSIYFEVPNSSDGSNAFYQYSSQTVQQASIDLGTFNQASPNYRTSPSGNHTVWSTLSNGENLFQVGDGNASGQHQIATVSGYSTFGWFSDNYILASRSNDQLYIMPSSGLSGTQQPYKIATYYEPDTLSTIGYEYGGY